MYSFHLALFVNVYSHITEERKSLFPEAFGGHVMQEMLSLRHKIVVTFVEHAWVGDLHLQLRSNHNVPGREILVDKSMGGQETLRNKEKGEGGGSNGRWGIYGGFL